MAIIERESWHDSREWGHCYVVEMYDGGDCLVAFWTCDTKAEMLEHIGAIVASGNEARAYYRDWD